MMTSRILFLPLLRRRNGLPASTRHAGCRITLSRNDLAVLVSGNAITVSPVSLPAAAWLFGSGVARLVGLT